MRALVTGAGGFLGGALVRALLGRGDEIHTLQRGQYPALEQPGITVFTGSVADRGRVLKAAAGCEIIFHVAARAGIWGGRNEYYESNVIGTGNIIDACKLLSIKKLVYTSSPSVVFDGEDEEGVDESIPYSRNMFNHYQRTKAKAEQMIMQANGDSLATVSLRPHLMWGPGDTQVIPRIIERAKLGKLRLVNVKDKLIDATHIDNAVKAHLLAADKVSPGAACAGKTYFIGNGEPMSVAVLINGFLGAAGLAPVNKRISPWRIYFIGAALEWMYTALRIKQEPIMTRFLAKQLSCSHWYDLSAARRDLGYVPVITTEQGLKQLTDALAK